MIEGTQYVMIIARVIFKNIHILIVTAYCLDYSLKRNCQSLLDQTLMKWPPRSPDLTPLILYFWGYTKGKVYKSPFPQTMDELKVRSQ